MTLDNIEQQVILDFYFRCGSEEDVARGRDLIASNPEAARLYAGLEETLTELDSIKYEPCPDNLVELTIARLKLAASQSKAAGQTNLEKLLTQERQKTPVAVAPRFGRRFYEIGLAAAAVLFIAAVFGPTVSAMRKHNWQVACAGNLRTIGQAMSHLAGESANASELAPVAAGSSWNMIGDQSPNSASITSYPWQLIKRGFVEPEIFVCKGHKGASPAAAEIHKINSLYDFPSRSAISYSVAVRCNQAVQTPAERIIMSDRNPIFSECNAGLCDSDFCEKNKVQHSEPETKQVLIGGAILNLNSPNHFGDGQNVLHFDGSVQFIRVRVVDNDDIFTIQGVNRYTGSEIPSCENDVFLAP